MKSLNHGDDDPKYGKTSVNKYLALSDTDIIPSSGPRGVCRFLPDRFLPPVGTDTGASIPFPLKAQSRFQKAFETKANAST